MRFFRSNQVGTSVRVLPFVAQDAGRGDPTPSGRHLGGSGWSRPVVVLVLSAFLSACGCGVEPESPTPTTPPGTATVVPSVTPSPSPTPTPTPVPCASAFSDAQAEYLARRGMGDLLVEPQLMPYFLNRKSGQAGEWQGRIEQYVGCLTGFFRDGGIPLEDPTSGCDVAMAHMDMAIPAQDFDAYVNVFERALKAGPESLFAPHCMDGYTNTLEGILVDGKASPDGNGAVKAAVVDSTQSTAPSRYNLANQTNPVGLWDGLMEGQKLSYQNALLAPFYQNGAQNQRRHTYCLARYLCWSWAGPCEYGQEVLFSERNQEVCALYHAAGVITDGLQCEDPAVDLSPYVPVADNGSPDPAWYLKQFSLDRGVAQGGEQVCQDFGQSHARYEGLITEDEGKAFLNNVYSGLSKQEVDSSLLDTYYGEQLNDSSSELNQVMVYRPVQETAEFYALPLYQQLYGIALLSGTLDSLRSGMEQQSAYDSTASFRQRAYINSGAYFLNDQPDVAGYDTHMLRWKQCMSRYLCELTDGPCVYGDEKEDADDVAAGYEGLVLLLSDELGEVCRPISNHAGGVFHGMGISDSDYTDYLSAMLYSSDTAFSGEIYDSRQAMVERLNTSDLKGQVVDESSPASVYQAEGGKIGMSGAVRAWHLYVTAEDSRLAEFFPSSSLETGSRMNRCLTRLLCEALGGPCVFGADAAELTYAASSLGEAPCKASVDELAALHSTFKAQDGSGISYRDFEVYAASVGINMACSADACVAKKVLYQYCPAIVTDPENCPEPETVCTDTGPCQ